MTYSDTILLWTILNNPYTIWACATTLKFIETVF
jgi:hypothetical protein